MSDFLSEAILLLPPRPIYYKELKFNQYRNLLKCFLGDEINVSSILLNITNIIKNCTDLTDFEIQNLSYIDFFLLLLQIRTTSLGNVLPLVVEISDKPLKIDLNLDAVINHVYKTLPREIFEIHDDNTFYFKLPTINEIKKIENNKQDITIFFISKIVINDTDICFLDYTDNEKEKILQKLPLKTLITINKQIKNIFTHINDSNFLHPLYSESFNHKLTLLPDLNNIAFLLKLIFNNSLQHVYETIFILSKFAHLTGNFLDNCTPGEFFYFSKKFEELNIQTTKNEQTNLASNLPPVNEDSSLFQIE